MISQIVISQAIMKLEIYQYKENRVVISKDSDFLDSYLIKKTPAKTVLITTVSCTNNDLLSLFKEQFSAIYKLFEINSYTEMNAKELIIYE
jgi:predicted nuclease of predicted toxin-antitoxin system